MSSSILPNLKNTFGGGVPTIVYEHLKYFTFDEDREEFTCVLCDKVIQKRAVKNLEAHIKSVYHRERSYSKDEVIQALSKTFQGKVPQIIQNNAEFLDVVDGGYECVLCDKIMKVSKDPKISVDNFSYHLTSSGHEENLDEFDEKVDQLNDVYGDIPQVVDNNKEFLRLDKSGKNYECTVCNFFLKVNEHNIEKTEKSFEKHFYSSEHIWGVKRSKVYLLIPELQHSNETVHTYLMRNIDYISTNGTDFFCSLCHENIKRNCSDVRETIENLKHHVFSPNHEDNIFGRQNHDNEVLDNLNKVIGVFSDNILKNLQYLELSDNCFYCRICDEKINTESDCDESNENLMLHFESDFHESNLSKEVERRAYLTEKLENTFGETPLLIQNNLAYLELAGGNLFNCTLCDVTLHLRNLESHLRNSEHEEGIEDVEKVSELLDDELEALLGSDYVDKMPECIRDNWVHLEFENDKGYFCCTLCKETILADEGNKKEEITMQNFKRHFYSLGHIAKLKHKAKKELETYEKLESIYGGIPKSVLSNVEFLYENDENSFLCDLCQVEIQIGSYHETLKRNFLQHLRSSLHKSNIKGVDTLIDNAFKFLDKKFCIPEGLLRDVDFWDNSSVDSNLYCTLCQKDLPVDLSCLIWTRRSLQCHVDSERHKSNLEDL